MPLRRNISLKEIGQHTTKESCWIVLHGKVLDVTSFLPDHPGGVQQILKYAGCDASEVWDSLHEKSFLDKYLTSAHHVGWVEGFEPVETSTSEMDSRGAGMNRLVLIGHGPVCQHFMEALIKQTKKVQLPHSQVPYSITVFCEEIRPAYDRVGLSKFFEHQDASQMKLMKDGWDKQERINLMVGNKAEEIDREGRRVRGSDGTWHPYDKLIICTGSYAFVPPIQSLSVQIQGVYVYRTIEDMEAMISHGKSCSEGGVIGGGLLGLEAAKAVMDLGLKTHVFEGAPFLMPAQLDARGGHSLHTIIADLGIECHLGCKIMEVVHEAGVLRGLRIAAGEDGSEIIPLQMLVVSCGVRPRDEIARAAELEVHSRRGGVVVDAELHTSDPDIFAIGEVANFNGIAYGLVAPGFEQARVLANNLVSDLVNGQVARQHYSGSDLSTKLKLLGVDVASFGQSDAFWSERIFEQPSVEEGGDVVYLKQEDPFSGHYRKLVFNRDGTQLLGGICVGDASDYMALTSLCKKGMEGRSAKELFMGGGTVEVDASALEDGDTICTCQGVTAGMVREAVTETGIETMADLKTETKCGIGCGGCVMTTGFVPKIFASALAAIGKEAFTGICPHFPFSRQELYEIVKLKGLKDFESIIAEAGSKDCDQSGCEVCKPVCASILASLWNELVVKEDLRTVQDTNDRYLGNIQRSGQYSVIPRVPGGEVTPDELALLSAVAKKWGLWTKITGGQRIGLYGANMQDLPSIYREVTSGTVDGVLLCEGGMESGHAYGKALRTVKSCVGSSWCRYGQQDSVAMAVMLENRYKGLRAPHKIKFGVSGCIRECAEARGKDIGLIATPKGYNLYVCGNHGASPIHAQLFAGDLSVADAIQNIDRVLQYYISTAGPLVRTSKWLENLEGGLQHLQAVVIQDKLGICQALDEQMAHHIATYKCEWKEVVDNPKLQIGFKQFVNVDDSRKNGDLKWMDERWDARPGKQKKISNKDFESVVGPSAFQARARQAEGDKRAAWSWVAVGKTSDFPANGGAAVKISNSELAVFNHTSTGKWFATQNMCPHKQLMVLSRGLVGMDKGAPKVACPIHKNTFKLEDGKGISNKGFNLSTFEVKIEDDLVSVHVPPFAELDEKLARVDPQELPDDCTSCSAHSDGIMDIEDMLKPTAAPRIAAAM